LVKTLDLGEYNFITMTATDAEKFDDISIKAFIGGKLVGSDISSRGSVIAVPIP